MGDEGELGMTTRDEWFAVHASGRGTTDRGSVGPVGSAVFPSPGFLVEPEAMPAVRALFEEAADEMSAASEAAQNIAFLAAGGSVNPVVDKYMAAMIDRATGEAGSLLAAADSAAVAYRDVLDQLVRAMAIYRENEEQVEQRFSQG